MSAIAGDLDHLVELMACAADDLASSGRRADADVITALTRRAGRIAADMRGSEVGVTADPWEDINAGEFRIDDEIEIHRSWEGGTTAVYRGRVGDCSPPYWVTLHGLITVTTDQAGTIIRRRVRTPMAEPDAPAVVRHAGRIIARSVYDTDTSQWEVLAGALPEKALPPFRWFTWLDVLTLDPSTDPVLVDLGAPTGVAE